jgi:hypothetical protein
MSAITGPPVCEELGGLFYDNHHKPVQTVITLEASPPPSPTFDIVDYSTQDPAQSRTLHHLTAVLTHCHNG